MPVGVFSQALDEHTVGLDAEVLLRRHLSSTRESGSSGTASVSHSMSHSAFGTHVVPEHPIRVVIGRSREPGMRGQVVAVGGPMWREIHAGRQDPVLW